MPNPPSPGDPPAAPVPDTGDAFSWSQQPPRSGDWRMSRRGILAIAVAAAVVVAALAVVVGYQVRSLTAPPPDLRPLLVAPPTEAAPCPSQPDELISAYRLEISDDLPRGVASMMESLGLRAVAARCWLWGPGGGSVRVALLRFETAKGTQSLLEYFDPMRLALAGATDIAGVPGVPGGRVFTQPNVDDGQPWVWAVGSRGDTAFMISSLAGPSFDPTTLIALAREQYGRL